MTENNVLEFTGREEITDPLTELLKSGAQQLIRHAVEGELAEFMSQYSELQTEDGKAPKESSVAASSIRVHVDVLEDLMTLVSELVLTRNQLLQMVRGRDQGVMPESVV